MSEVASRLSACLYFVWKHMTLHPVSCYSLLRFQFDISGGFMPLCWWWIHHRLELSKIKSADEQEVAVL